MFFKIEMKDASTAIVIPLKANPGENIDDSFRNIINTNYAVSPDKIETVVSDLKAIILEKTEVMIGEAVSYEKLLYITEVINRAIIKYMEKYERV